MYLLLRYTYHTVMFESAPPQLVWWSRVVPRAKAEVLSRAIHPECPVDKLLVQVMVKLVCESIHLGC